MVCIYCGSETKVVNSRPQKRLNQVWRRRECIECRGLFSTQEVAQYDQAWIVVKGQQHSAFSRDKLLLSLYKSLEHRKSALTDAAALTETIIKKLLISVNNGAIETGQIAQVSLVALTRFDKVAATHYQAFHKDK